MAHSHVSALFHCVFATKNREPILDPEMREALYKCIAGVGRKHGFVVRAIGGVADHVHVLVSLPSSMPIAQSVKLMKGASSHWVHDAYPERAAFAWQEGYGAFSIGVAGLARTVAYIKGQESHHRSRSGADEFASFLTRHGLQPEDPAPALETLGDHVMSGTDMTA